MISNEIQSLTDEQLRSTLVEYNITVGPITSSTRKLYERKLARLREELPAMKLFSDDDKEEEEEEAAAAVEEETKKLKSSAFIRSTTKHKGNARANELSERKRPRVLRRKMSSNVSKLHKANNLFGYSDLQDSQLTVPHYAHLNDCSTDNDSVSEISQCTDENSVSEISQCADENAVSEDSQSTQENSVSEDSQSSDMDTNSQNEEWIANIQNKNIGFVNVVIPTSRSDKKKSKAKSLYKKSNKDLESNWNIKSNQGGKSNLKNSSKFVSNSSNEETILNQNPYIYSALQQPVNYPVRTVKGNSLSPLLNNVSGGYSAGFVAPQIAGKSHGKPMHTNLPSKTISSLEKNRNLARKMLPRYSNQCVDAMSVENTHGMKPHSIDNVGFSRRNNESNVTVRNVQFSNYSTQYTPEYTPSPVLSSSHLSSNLSRRPLNSRLDQDQGSYTSLRNSGVTSSATTAKAGMSWFSKLLILIVLVFMIWMIFMNFEYQPSVPSLTSAD